MVGENIVEKQKKQRTTGIILMAVSMVSCLGAILCGSLAPLLGRDAYEPQPLLITLFIGAIVVSLLAQVAFIAGIVFVILSTQRGGAESEELACPACGAGNPADHAYCDRCGARLYEEIV